jgi:predicted nucleic acid-binding Zn ribbon protein
MKDKDMSNFDFNEPQHINIIMDDIVREFGLEEEVIFEKIKLIWKDMVGENISKKTKLKKLENGNLIIETSSSTWRTELLLRTQSIMKEINKICGKDVVSKIIIR